MYAFSVLTARTGSALVAFAYLSAATDPATFTNPALITTTAVMLLVATGCFVLPLFGMHGRILVEKARLEAEAGEHLGRALKELNIRGRAGYDAGAGALTRVIEGLVIQRTMIRAIPTWPWRTETLRGFVSAVVLPIGLWL